LTISEKGNFRSETEPQLSGNYAVVDDPRRYNGMFIALIALNRSKFEDFQD